MGSVASSTCRSHVMPMHYLLTYIYIILHVRIHIHSTESVGLTTNLLLLLFMLRCVNGMKTAVSAQ